jgi:hypothetical protein
VSLVSLTGATWYSIAKVESMPVKLQNSSLSPFLDIVPSQDGTSLFVRAGNVGQLAGIVFANVDIGPGHKKRGYTMIYSDTVQNYMATAVDFTPQQSTFGSLSITTTLGLDTGMVEFNRAYVPASTSQTIDAADGNLQLSLVSTDTINFNTYIVIVPSYAPPGLPPPGHHLIGRSYSIRAAGALLETDKPMSLRLYYNDITLAGADPHTLAIFAWDAFNKEWINLGGRLIYGQQYLAVATSRFTTYALMATSTWRDEFDDISFSGLNYPAEVSNITLGGTAENRTLILASTPGNGYAVSKPITPTSAINNWVSLTFSHNAAPPTTTLTVDVLSLDGTKLMTNVTSGVSLAGLDPAQYPALKLQVNLGSTVAGQTAALDNWQVTWQPKGQKVYLPILLKKW